MNTQDSTNNDLLILDEIKKRLADNPHLDETGIITEVNNGRVILKGKIDTEEEKVLAEKIAGFVPGVSEVENHLHLGFGLANTLAKIVSNMSEIDIEKDKKKEKE
jgi:osmotically-inducible protein OsmY